MVEAALRLNQNPCGSGPRSPADLFWTFTRIALQGFGGVLAVAQHELVDRRGWLTRTEYTDVLSVAQVLPGPNVVNLSLTIGDRAFGWRGAVASLAGMLLAPLVIVLALAALYGRWSGHVAADGALRGMTAVASGMVLGSAWKLGRGLARSPLSTGTALVVAASTFVATGLLHWPLAAVLAGLGGLTVVVAWYRLRNEAPSVSGR